MKFVIDMMSQCWFSRLSIEAPCDSDGYVCIRTGRVCDGDLDKRPHFCVLEKLVSVPTKVENFPFEAERWGYEKDPDHDC